MSYQLVITHNQTSYLPPVLDGIEWSTERAGSPGKLTFSTLGDDSVRFEEGDSVQFFVENHPVFLGYLFTQKHTQNTDISWTAYDQLRYLQNKDTLLYKNKTASEVIELIADITLLETGTIQDTGLKLAKRLEEETSYFEMIQYALDETLKARKQQYVLYDEVGKLTLKNIESMLLDLILDEETGQSFDYTSSIDSNTYNRVKLFYQEQEKSGTGSSSAAKTSRTTSKKSSGPISCYPAEDVESIRKWGLLQYVEKIQSNVGALERAQALLSLYNRKTKNLSISGAAGDIRVRAGTSVIVNLSLGDGTKLQNYMVVEKAKHTFKESEHTMDLTLRGGDFVV